MEEQKRRGRPPKQPIDNPRHKPMVCVRDPVVENRDPVIEQPQKRPYNQRRFIPASMPTVCPNDGHTVRKHGGTHNDPVRGVVLSYVECPKCKEIFGAGRPMTDREKERCAFEVPILSDYEVYNKSNDRN